jgi:hypothetical protein
MIINDTTLGYYSQNSLVFKQAMGRRDKEPLANTWLCVYYAVSSSFRELHFPASFAAMLAVCD